MVPTVPPNASHTDPCNTVARAYKLQRDLVFKGASLN
jgi:hypothetical protein